jgi:DNA gyrase subunit B
MKVMTLLVCLRFITHASSALLIQLIVVMSQTQALEVTVWRDGKEYRQSYSRGKPLTTLNSITLSGETSSLQGTRIRFWPDKDSKLLFFKSSLV